MVSGEKMLSVKNIKKTAQNILNNDWFAHICAFLLPAICTICFLSVGIILADFVPNFAGENTYNVTVFLLTAFTAAMVIPFAYGYSVFMTNCVKNGKADFLDMFSPFSSQELFFRSFKLFYALLWRFLIVFAIPIVFIEKFITYLNSGKSENIVFYGYDITYTFFVIVIALSSVISAVIFSRYALAMYICVIKDDKKVSECFFSAKIHLKTCIINQNRLALSFIALLLLGFLSFGILFIYIIPLIYVSQFKFAMERYEDTTLNQKTKDLIFN